MSDNHTEYKGSILCLGGSQESLPIIQRIRELDYRPIVLDQNPNCAAVGWIKEKSWWLPPDKTKRSALFIKANCYDFFSCRNALSWAVKKERRLYDDGFFNLDDLVGVMCCAIDAPLVQAQLAERYNLLTIGIEAAKYGANKYWQYQKLHQYGILVPPTSVANPELAWDEVSDYQIVKPIDSRGARGVRFYDETNYREAFVESMQWSKLRSAVIQKFIPGRQFSTESVIWDGEVLMTSVAERNYDRLEEFSPYIVEDGCDSVEPSRLNKQINSVIKRSCIALGWNNCTVKGDLILDGNLLYILELAPRLSGGFLSTHTTPLSMGWDIVGDAIGLAAGEGPTIGIERVEQFVSQRYFFGKRDWVGKLISKLPEFPPEVNFGTWNVKLGDIIPPVKNHPSRLGQIICTGESHTEAVSKATTVIKQLTEEIEVE